MLLFGPGLTLIVVGSLLALDSFITAQIIFISVGSSIVTGQILLMHSKC